MRQTIAILVFASALVSFPASTPATGIKSSGYMESESGFIFPDGTIQTSAAEDYKNIIDVAKSGADFTSIQSAIDSVTDAMPDSPYLIRVAPGYYFESLVMKPSVDVKGAGPALTHIRTSSHAVAVKLAEYSGLSSLSVYCYTANGCIGIQAKGNIRSAAVRDVHVSVNASQAGAVGTAIEVSAVSPDHADVDLDFVTADAAAHSLSTGVLISGKSDVTFRNTVVRALRFERVLGDARGVDIDGPDARVWIYDSRIEASGYPKDATGARVVDGLLVLRYSRLWVYSAEADSLAKGLEIRGGARVEMEYSALGTNAADEWGILAQNNADKVGGMDIKVMHSSIQAREYTVFNPITDSNAVYLFTHFDGGAVLGANNTCSYSTDETYATYDSTCPP